VKPICPFCREPFFTPTIPTGGFEISTTPTIVDIDDDDIDIFQYEIPSITPFPQEDPSDNDISFPDPPELVRQYGISFRTITPRPRVIDIINDYETETETETETDDELDILQDFITSE
jgi:hypothetical protein